MVLFLILTALLNIFCGYGIAVNLGHARWNPLKRCNETQDSSHTSKPLPKVVTKTNNQQIRTGSKETEQAFKPQASEASRRAFPQNNLPAKEAKPTKSIRSETATTLEKLKAIKDKLHPLRSFGDKSIAHSLSNDFKGLTQAQFGLWEQELDGRISDSASEALMQQMAQAEAVQNNIGQLDWNGSLDDIIDSIDKQLSMFEKCLAE